MDTIIRNSENRKTSDPHKVLLDLPDKIFFKMSDKYVALSNLSICYIWKNIKMSYKNRRLKLSAPTINLNYLMDHILYQIFKIILGISSKTLNSD